MKHKGMKTAAGAVIAAALAAAAGLSVAQETVLRVNVFPGSQNLPIFTGLERGVFAKYGLKIELQNTPNSDEQRAGLAAGKFEIAHAAVDNAVAMVEMAGRDVIIVMGGDGSMNEFMVRPEIAGFSRHPRQGPRRGRAEYRVRAGGEEDPEE